MKKLAYIYFILTFTCCSSSDDRGSNNEETGSFGVTVNQDFNTVTIDQTVTLTATSSETINSIDFSLDGGVSFRGEYSSSFFGTSVNLYLDFDTIGTKNIIFRVKNNKGNIVDTPITVNVEKGNAVQLKNLKLNSFYDMGNTWDPEYGDTNPNRLADVYFAILKPRLNVFDGSRSSVPTSSWLWYKSPTRENETNLNWDLESENLYINVEQLTPYIAFVDDDGEGNVIGDLMLGPPFERIIPISDYIATKPNSIVVTESAINLEYELTLGW